MELKMNGIGVEQVEERKIREMVNNKNNVDIEDDDDDNNDKKNTTRQQQQQPLPPR